MQAAEAYAIASAAGWGKIAVVSSRRQRRCAILPKLKARIAPLPTLREAPHLGRSVAPRPSTLRSEQAATGHCAPTRRLI